MATHRYGTLRNPAHYVEIPDLDYVDTINTPPTTKTKRPAAGTHLMVQNADTGANLPDIVTTDYGYWAYTVDDVPKINVSGDGGTTWVGPLISIDAELSALASGQNAESALALGNSLDDRLTAVENSRGVGGGIATLTADGNIPAAQLTSVSSVVQNGDGSWPVRPATNRPLVFVMIVPGSNPPANGGPTGIAGGGGMVPVFDVLRDVTGTYGA